jgi:all-trans-retinol dehydrogenase (NAD+)
MSRARALAGRRAVVTGGARGIGRATARRLVAAGVTTTIWDLDEQALEAAREELVRAAPDHEDGVLTARVDVADPQALDLGVSRAVDEMGGIDILVNNAGTLAGGPFHEQPVEAQRRMIEVNFAAVVHLTRLVLPHMQESGGHVVNVASASSTLGVPDLAVYAATKWAVWGLTESLRHEAVNAGRRDLRFSSVHPNYVATGLFEGARIPGLGGLLVPRVGSHDEVARAIVEKCLIRGRRQVLIPGTVRLAVLLRALLPYPAFLWTTRALGVNRSMSGWHGRPR